MVISMNDITFANVVFDKEYFYELRKNKKIKLKEIAHLTGLDVTTISDLSQGTNKYPRASTIYKIAMVLDCQMEDLMKEI